MMSDSKAHRVLTNETISPSTKVTDQQQQQQQKQKQQQEDANLLLANNKSSTQPALETRERSSEALLRRLNQTVEAQLRGNSLFSSGPTKSASGKPNLELNNNTITASPATTNYNNNNNNNNNNNPQDQYTTPAYSYQGTPVGVRMTADTRHRKSTGNETVLASESNAQARPRTTLAANNVSCPSTASATPTRDQADSSITTASSPQVPSYTSLFTTPSSAYTASSQTSRPVGHQSGRKLSKQSATDLADAPTVRTQSSPKKLTAYNFSPIKQNQHQQRHSVTNLDADEHFITSGRHIDEDTNEEDEDDDHQHNIEANCTSEDEEEDEEEIDEKVPFSKSSLSVNSGANQRGTATKRNQQQARPNSKRSDPSGRPTRASVSGQTTNRRLMAAPGQAASNKCDPPQSDAKSAPTRAHTKISMHTESRPPSFNTCQASEHDSFAANKKQLDWQHAGHQHLAQHKPLAQGCHKCECSNCRKRRKAIMMDGYDYVAANRRQSRTKTIHLVLKSIILVLLTILLVLILLGIFAASHYLPQMLDRVVNVSRSFNVTIAG